MIIAAIILTGLWVFIVGGLLYVGITGLRGRAIWVPNRGGISGKTVKGTPARVLGGVYTVMGFFLIVFTIWRMSI